MIKTNAIALDEAGHYSKP